MADKTISCQDCGKEFIFTEEEQNYYNEKGFQSPKRCKACRTARNKQNPRAGSGARGRSGGQGTRGSGSYNRW